MLRAIILTGSLGLLGACSTTADRNYGYAPRDASNTAVLGGPAVHGQGPGVRDIYAGDGGYTAPSTTSVQPAVSGQGAGLRDIRP